MNKIFIFIILIVAGVSVILMLTNKTNTKMPDIKGVNTNPTQTQIVTPTQVVSEPTAVNSPTISPASEENKISKAVIKTNKGDITLTLFSDKAPNTVNNFVTKAKSGFYNNLTFHRVEDWVIQGGDPLGNGTGGGKMSTELNNEPFVVGSLGVARGQDIKISNDAQFFITKTEASWLNNQYANFGIVTSGMDVVDKMAIGDKILEITVE